MSSQGSHDNYIPLRWRKSSMELVLMGLEPMREYVTEEAWGELIALGMDYMKRSLQAACNMPVNQLVSKPYKLDEGGAQ